MWKIFVIFLLVVPQFSFAKTYTLPSGISYKEEMPIWIEKIFILPSGFRWTELIKIAKAEELNLTLKEQIVAYMSFVADKYGVNIRDMDKLITCESGYNPDAKGDYKNGVPSAIGILQFWKGTFDAFKKEAKMPQLEYTDWHSQLELGSWAISKGYQNHWKWCWNNAVLNKKWP